MESWCCSSQQLNEPRPVFERGKSTCKPRFGKSQRRLGLCEASWFRSLTPCGPELLDREALGAGCDQRQSRVHCDCGKIVQGHTVLNAEWHRAIGTRQLLVISGYSGSSRRRVPCACSCGTIFSANTPLVVNALLLLLLLFSSSPSMHQYWPAAASMYRQNSCSCRQVTTHFIVSTNEPSSRVCCASLQAAVLPPGNL